MVNRRRKTPNEHDRAADLIDEYCSALEEHWAMSRDRNTGIDC